MGKLAWSQLRFRTVRLLALVAGMVVATAAFTVLTSASSTAQLRTVGTVTAHFVPAYDILVRPQGAKTGLERKQDDSAAQLPVRHLRRHHHGAVSEDRADSRRPGRGADRDGRLYAAGRRARPPASGGRVRRARPCSSTGSAPPGSATDGTSRMSRRRPYLYVTPSQCRPTNSNAAIEELPGGAAVTSLPSRPCPREGESVRHGGPVRRRLLVQGQHEWTSASPSASARYRGVLAG